MIRELVRDAIYLKMKAQKESPLISVYEFCFAAGLGLAKTQNLSAAENLRTKESFLDFKKEVQREAKEASGWDRFPHGERLQSLILGCRIDGEMDEDARALFEMGLRGEHR